MRKICIYMRELWRLNILKTIYFNFKMLPFKQAVKFPFFLYGKIILLDLSGRVSIESEIRTGMIRIGYKWIDMWPTSFLPTQIYISGEIIFQGSCIVSGGANLSVHSNRGSLFIGKNVLIGGGSIVKCLKRIEIGEDSRITGNCVVMDCNMHFIKNIDTGTVANYMAPIKIGKRCWITPGSNVLKGAVIPDYSITSRNAYLSKDYSEFGTNLFLVGSPAKPSSSRVQRIVTIDKQNEIAEYFKLHDVAALQLDPGIEEEEGIREGFRY